MAAQLIHRIAGLDGRATLCFVAVGAAATGVYLGLALAGSWLGLPAALSSLAAFSIAAMWSYAGHRWLTFRSDAPATETAPRFVALSAAQYSIALAVPALLADYAGVRADIAYLGVCVLVPLSSLVLMPRLVFTATSSQFTWRLPVLSEAATWSCVVATILAIVSFFSGPLLLADPDTQWHLATGRWMIENGALLRRDIFSYTFDGTPWIAKEWLSQLLLAAVYVVSGWNGVGLVTVAAPALAAGLVMHHVALRTSVPAGAAAALLVLAVIAPTVVARPHVFALPIVAVWTIALARACERNGPPPWLALLLLVLWSNLHAGFTIGLLIAGAFGIEALLLASHETRSATALRWLVFGGACLVACLLTPHGAGPLLINAQMASGNEAIQFIGEWRGFELTPRWMFLTAVVAASIAALSAKPRENAARILLIVALASLTFKHVRFAMILGVVSPIIAGPALWQWLQTISRRLGLFQDGMVLPAWLKPQRALGAAVMFAVALIVARPLSPPPMAAPVAALASVPAHIRAERVFNSYDFGGFLAFNGVKTFIDGRTDQLFLGGFMTRMMTATEAREPRPLAALLDEYQVGWAIIAAQKPETRVFPHLEGWRLHYKDAAAQVWVRQR